jgi:predicted TPR repeat methyltransferase
LVYCLEVSGDKKSAEKSYGKCFKHHPGHDVATQLLNSLIGNTTVLAPPTYITKLCDHYADSVDESLLNELDYVVPKLLKTELQRFNTPDSLGTVLDLGCGTGLVTRKTNASLICLIV